MTTTVFLSHSSNDKNLARKLFEALTEIGIRVWFDEREIKVGDDILNQIERGIKETDYIALLLTPNSVNSRWVMEELNAFRMDQYGGKAKTVLPLLFEDCEIPPLLRSKKYADFRSDFDSGFRELIRALGHEPIELKNIKKISVSPTDSTYNDVIKNLSFIWDPNGKYRNPSWAELKDLAKNTRGGLSILTEDLLEMVEYKPAPFRDKAWLLRNTFKDLIKEAIDQDVDMLAKMVVSAWDEYQDNLNAAWWLVLMPKPLAASVLTKAFEISPKVTKWIFRTVYDFVADEIEGEYIFEADLIKEAGYLPPELKKFERGDM